MKVLLLILALVVALMLQREPFRVQQARKVKVPTHQENIQTWKSML